MKPANQMQLTLGVSLQDEATFSNFFSGQNQLLVNTLREAAEGKGERMIYFYSAEGGGGCTHLLQALCHEAHQYHRTTLYLPLEHLEDYSPTIFEGLESLALICIDDIHRIAGKKNWEEAFFHFYNRLLDSGSQLIVTANTQPKFLKFVLPDIQSRLAWGIVLPLHLLSDEEKLQVLINRASRRGMTLPLDVAKFMLRHCPRHMSTLFFALDVLDKGSLAAQRRLTIPFVKTVLQL